MNQIQRYNQGFLKFGPMEQCSDGKWVKYDDVKKRFSDYEDEICDLMNFDMINDATIENLKKHIDRITHLNSLLIGLVTLIGFIIIGAKVIS